MNNNDSYGQIKIKHEETFLPFDDTILYTYLYNARVMA